jgi:MFS transporter, DHA2 family, multidrug resistance protein
MSSRGTPRAGRREWIGLAVLALATVLYSVDLTVLHLAVPALSADLKPSSAQLLWIVDIYGFLLAGSLITMGTLGDRIGSRRVLMFGAAAFGVASVLAALSTSAEMLIGARALLGVAGATLLPSTLSLIRNMFQDSRQRTLAVGVWVTTFNVGALLGPPLGGVLLELFWWGAVFLMAVPVMALLLVLGPVLLPEFRDPAARRFDLLSAAMSLAAVLAVTYGFKQIVQDGFGPLSALSIVAGVALGLVFVQRQRQLAEPLVDLKLFRMRAFSSALVAYLFVTFIAFATFLFIFQYLQLVLGLSPLEAALWAIPSSSAFIVGSLATVRVVRWFRPAYTIGGGLALAGVGYVLLAFADQDSGLALVVTASVIAALGEAPAFTLINDLVIGTAPPERAGAAASISETSSELGGAFGIAILGGIGTALYRGQIGEGIPQGTPPEEAAAARDTLGGAVAAGEQLPAPLAAELVEAAREAFIQGLQVAALTSAAIAAMVAVSTAILLRHVGAAPEGGRSTEAERGVPVAAAVEPLSRP